jgi:dTDP-glucose 4,6-dehydratase
VNALDDDLSEILERNERDFDALRGARIFVTGGTGFVGSWLLESFAYANRRLGLGARAVLLTRDVGAAARSLSHITGDPAIDLVQGDVRDMIEVDGTFDAIVHAATPTSAKLNAETPLLMMDTAVNGTRRVLELAERSGSIPVLLTSSGAVYGRQPPELALVDESFTGAPDPLNPRNAYHEAKRFAELLCAIAGDAGRVQPKIARMFAFVGPYLPLDRHFAIGNFIGDGLAGRPIKILGDGTPVRTYQYASDMTSWLWRILVRGAALRAYNVGSEETVDIRGTADAVAASTGNFSAVTVCETSKAGSLPERYACATSRARLELDLEAWTGLDEALRRTIAWHRRSRPSP